MRSSLALLLLGCAACAGAPPAHVSLDVSEMIAAAQTGGVALSTLRLLVTADGVVLAEAEVSPETQSFEVEVEAGPARRFEVVGRAADEAPLYFGETVADLVPGDNEVTFHAYRAGGVSGVVSTADGTALPPGFILPIERLQPEGRGPELVEVPVAEDGAFSAILVDGVWISRVYFDRDGTRYAPISGQIPLSITQGYIVELGAVRLFPPDFCELVDGAFPDFDADGSGCDVDCDDSRPDLSTADVDLDGVSSCAGDCEDFNPDCLLDCADADSDLTCRDQDCDDNPASGASCATGCLTVYVDGDSDGHGDTGLTQLRCTASAGFAATGGDCDDINPFCNTDCADDDLDAFCNPNDCDPVASSCTSDCGDSDGDLQIDCLSDRCLDSDLDDYGLDTDGMVIGLGDIPVNLCTTDGSTPCFAGGDQPICYGTDCDDDDTYCNSSCVDGDSDGFCLGVDADDGKTTCGLDSTDFDHDGFCYDFDCDDSEPYCSLSCTDSDGDRHCDDDAGACDDDANTWGADCLGCVDGDGDGYFVGCDRYQLGLAFALPDCHDGQSALNWTDLDGDGVSTCEGDTNEGAVDANRTGPGRREWCGDGADNNGNGQTDEGCACSNLDGDGYCPPNDCDDSDDNRSFADLDGDGYTTCDPVPDCDDTSSYIHPGRFEDCADVIDTNCDGRADSTDPQCLACPDVDGDTYACLDCLDDASPVGPLLNLDDKDGDGFTPCSGDVDDYNPRVHPGLSEHCSDGADNDGNGALDSEDPACNPITCGADGDGDGSLACNDCDDTSGALNQKDLDGDTMTTCAGDCDDDDPDRTPVDLDGDGIATCGTPVDCAPLDRRVALAGIELCDGVDNDCDGLVDNGIDGDTDGVSDCIDNCVGVSNGGQLDIDSDGRGDACDSCGSPLESPAFREICHDTLDNDCDGGTDSLDPQNPCPSGCDWCGGGTDDEDCDGYFTNDGGTCQPAPAFVDCAPTDPAAHPGNVRETDCDDGSDNDCDGLADGLDADCERRVCDASEPLGGLLAGVDGANTFELSFPSCGMDADVSGPGSICSGTGEDAFVTLQVVDFDEVATLVEFCNYGLVPLEITDNSFGGCSEVCMTAVPPMGCSLVPMSWFPIVPTGGVGDLHLGLRYSTQACQGPLPTDFLLTVRVLTE